MPRLVAIASTSLAAVAMICVTPAPAQATGATRTWDDHRYTSKGYAKASVNVDFPSKRAFDIQGYVEDVCPKDGFGAYLSVSYDDRNSTGDGGGADWQTYADANGCGNGGVSFDPGPAVLGKGMTLTAVTFNLCYQDKNGDGSGAVVLDACVPQTFTNWRTK